MKIVYDAMETTCTSVQPDNNSLIFIYSSNIEHIWLF